MDVLYSILKAFFMLESLIATKKRRHKVVFPGEAFLAKCIYNIFENMKLQHSNKDTELFPLCLSTFVAVLFP